ncbi:hypothetical protein COLO4_33076 [Corchorus olitorius]|uniref:Uncharacterized protein n=1 Tax=Corchorus olitorius TaxID=93759 RepID=A0A1R3GWH0_9ROSI|nr:hypothetical protein COLO4_33076 [Corchorus olitorius]
MISFILNSYIYTLTITYTTICTFTINSTTSKTFSTTRKTFSFHINYTFFKHFI